MSSFIKGFLTAIAVFGTALVVKNLLGETAASYIAVVLFALGFVGYFYNILMVALSKESRYTAEIIIISSLVLVEAFLLI